MTVLSSIFVLMLIHGGSKMGFIPPNLTYEDTCNYYINIVHTLGFWFINTNASMHFYYFI
jgi:hypothetical protein